MRDVLWLKPIHDGSHVNAHLQALPELSIYFCHHLSLYGAPFVL